MQKYIVKNTITNEISEQDIQQAFIDNLLEKGFEYGEYIRPTQEEVDNYNNAKIQNELMSIKNKKIQDLNLFYTNDKCWLFTVSSTELNAELTKTADWFAKLLPAVNGNITLFDKNNRIINATLTSAQALTINNQINIVKSFEIKQKYIDIFKMINNATTIANIDAINIEAEFNKVIKKITI